LTIRRSTFYTPLLGPTTSVGGSGHRAGAAGQFNSSNARDFDITGLGVFSAAIAGSYVPRTSLTGAATSVYGNTAFSATYQAAYEQPRALPPWPDIFGQRCIISGVQNAVVTVNASGAFYGPVPGGCSSTEPSHASRLSQRVQHVGYFSRRNVLVRNSDANRITYYDAPSRQFIRRPPKRLSARRLPIRRRQVTCHGEAKSKEGRVGGGRRSAAKCTKAYAKFEAQGTSRAAIAQRLFGVAATPTLLPQLDEIAKHVLDQTRSIHRPLCVSLVLRRTSAVDCGFKPVDATH
jgi:hypothetical protein